MLILTHPMSYRTTSTKSGSLLLPPLTPTLSLWERETRQRLWAKETEQGFALVIVLWVVALLSTVAASLAFSMRTETTLA
ncbi:MAG: hypothetical protein ACREU9_03040, partial [Gammaproteobacteria bacterium]